MDSPTLHRLPAISLPYSGHTSLQRRLIFSIKVLLVLILAMMTLSSLHQPTGPSRDLPFVRAAELFSLPHQSAFSPLIQSLPATTLPATPSAQANLVPSPTATRTVLAVDPQLLIPAPLQGVPAINGQLILVDKTQQWLWAYDNGKLVYATPVTTGRPELPTPTGIYHVQYKITNTTFISSWPEGSPFYYTPEHVNYALYFKDFGFFIHDAPWRQAFGPGTEFPHNNPDGTPDTGSHGCVNVPTAAGAWLYTWANVGATIDIVD